MKKFNSFAFYALVAPVLTISAGTAVAQQPAGQDIDRAQQSTQRDQDDTQSNHAITQDAQNIPRDSQSTPVIPQTGAAHSDARSQAGMQHRGYIAAAPSNGMQLKESNNSEQVHLV